MKKHHSRHQIHALNLLRLPTVLLAVLFVLGLQPKASADACPRCESEIAYDQAVYPLRQQIDACAETIGTTRYIISLLGPEDDVTSLNDAITLAENQIASIQAQIDNIPPPYGRTQL